MNRRFFIQKLIKAIKAAALLWLLFPSYLVNRLSASEQTDMAKPDVRGMSLLQIAEQKLHHGNGIFLNLFSDRIKGDIRPIIKWKFFSKNHFKSYYKDEPITPVTIDWEPVRQHHGLAVTFIKHSSLMIKDLDQYFLIDPVFSRMFWFVKDFSPLANSMDDMPRPNHILVTHGHYDHMDKQSLARLDQNTHIITPLGYDSVFKDLEMRNRTQLDWFDSYEDNGRVFTLLPCNHWTMRNPRTGPNLSLWGSFLIQTASGFTIYISGDLAYFDYFQELGEAYDIDLAIINLGAYEPRWFMKHSHMNPSDTLKAFKDLKANHLMIVHWGTFRLGDEPVHFPPIHMKEEMEKYGITNQLVDVNHGQTLFYDKFVSGNV